MSGGRPAAEVTCQWRPRRLLSAYWCRDLNLLERPLPIHLTMRGGEQEETFCPVSTIQAVPTPGSSVPPGTSSVGEDWEYPNIRVLSLDASFEATLCLPPGVGGPTIYPVLLSGTEDNIRRAHATAI